MERKAYSVDEKLFNLLLKENFDESNTNELQKLFDNLPYEISDKWVFISDKTEREYQSESENYKVDHFFRYSRLSGYKYFSLIDYENSSTYKIGIPDVSESNDAMDRQKSVTISKTNTNSEDIIEIQKYVFDRRLTNQTQINNYLVNNMKEVLIKFFTDFFPYEFGRIQDRVKQNNSPTEHKNPFFVTYNVDLKQFQEHKNVVAEKLHTLKDIMDINIKEIFFKPYKNEDIISLINMEIRTMDLIRAINEYVRADACLYLQWRDHVRYNRFNSQMLSEYREREAEKENIKKAEEIISGELRNFSNDWYDNETLISSSKNSFYFRSRRLTAKIYNLFGNFISFIKNIPKWFWENLCKRWSKIRRSIRESEWIRVGIGYTFLAIVTAFFQAPISNWDKVITWFQELFQKYLIN
ncbi:MAG: hypothetical protein OYL97_22235 [Candidatus Poribacteria bacterium]|nr:hypothetical protein [Candidatus Poribacteria bacterium]